MARTLAKVKEIERIYMTVADVETYLGFGNADTQREWRKQGLRHCVLKRVVLYRKDDIDRFIERHRII